MYGGVRSSTSGTHAVDLLGSLADEMRREQRLAATEAARRAGVRAVLPLGVCFLPAFVLLGIVPTLVGLAGSVLVAR
jgi:pilus assembly protein TadC